MSEEPVLGEHVWPEVRDDFETQHEVSYCRRCGRLLVADYNPGFVQSKLCRRVPVTFRAASIDVRLT